MTKDFKRDKKRRSKTSMLGYHKWFRSEGDKRRYEARQRRKGKK